MSSESIPAFRHSLKVLEQVCRNKDISDSWEETPEWTNALNDCLSLAKKVARCVETARFLGPESWQRFMDVICSDTKPTEMLPETLTVLKMCLQSEDVILSVYKSAEFSSSSTALLQLAEVLENDHKSGTFLGKNLWDDLRHVVKQSTSLIQGLRSVQQPEQHPVFAVSKEKYLRMPLEEKRKLYKCGKRFKTLLDIPTLHEAAPRSNASVSSDLKPMFKVNEEFNRKISVFFGDITELEIDAIVNSTNSALLLGGGVHAAVHLAAGRDLGVECRTIGSCGAGQAILMGGYQLPAKYVIQTVGPIGENSGQLWSCYKNCLQLLLDHQLRSIAFCCISTGGYGYPRQPAAVTALKTVRDFLQAGDNVSKIDRIIFCLFDSMDATVYKDYLPVYFPVH